MAEHADDESRPASQKRVQTLLDCIAYLLAKRWPRDQRQLEEKSPQKKPAAHTE